MNSLRQLTLKQYLDGIKTKAFTAKEVEQDCQAEIKRINPQLNMFVSYGTRVSDSKQLIDNQLLGAPVALKDNILVKGEKTTASSNVLKKFVAPYSATVVDRLDHAGATIIGKTNLDAWAHGSSTETSDFGRTLNPRNPEYLPGGSSGGSAAAIAADVTIASVGTETAGSIRQPASWCGVVGLKPTYGRVSRYGIVAMASSTDSPGPITKTVEDSAILLNMLAGHDPLDGTSSTESVPLYTQFLGQSIKGLKIGVLYHDLEGLQALRTHLDEATQVLSSLGASVELATAMDPHYAIGVYTVVQRAEVSSNLARYDGIRLGEDRSVFGEEARRRIMLGTYTLAKGYADKYYLQAQKVRTLFIQDFERLFNKYDVIIHATSPGFAKEIGASQGSAMFGELEDMLMEPTSLSGHPGISVPCYHDLKTNLFLGLNISAPQLREDLIIQVADAYEKATPWNTWRNRHD